MCVGVGMEVERLYVFVRVLQPHIGAAVREAGVEKKRKNASASRLEHRKKRKNSKSSII